MWSETLSLLILYPDFIVLIGLLTAIEFRIIGSADYYCLGNGAIWNSDLHLRTNEVGKEEREREIKEFTVSVFQRGSAEW